MIYMENIFICLAAPLVIAFFLLNGEARRFVGFYWLGILVCLLAAYVNNYAAALLADNGYASLTTAQSMAQVTPICEEILKALPLFIFAAIRQPKRGEIPIVALAVGLGFATFENICYITQYGAAEIAFVLIRGFSAGVTHAVCAAILGYGFAPFCGRGRLAAPVGFALLCAASTYHAIYNLLVAGDGGWRTVGHVMPIATAAVILFFVMRKGNALHAEP
jgi:RsiW-degrading membrane proteinase PrsW (M82 family)